MTKKAAVLKIAFVLDDGLDTEDGVQAYIRTVGSWMEQQGHEVHYLVGETHRTDIPNVHSLARNVRVSFNGNKLTIPLPVNNRMLKEFLAKQGYDILHIQMPYSPFFGARVVAQAPPGTAVFGTFHILPYGLLARAGTRLLGMALARNLRRFDDYVSVSTAAKRFSKDAFKIDTDVVPNVVSLRDFMPKQPRKKNSQIQLLFLGRLVDRKGCSYLLDALAYLGKNYPELSYTLIVCGKGPLDAELQSKASSMGLSKIVHFAGFVSFSQKVRYMQQADIAIFPSYSGESFGIVLIEAMAAGSGVVIGGNNPGYASVLGELPETLVDVKSAAVFGERLAGFMKDQKLSDRIHAAQQQLVKQYDIEVVGAELIKRYANCKIKRLS